jgi:hypothetical protein
MVVFCGILFWEKIIVPLRVFACFSVWKGRMGKGRPCFAPKVKFPQEHGFVKGPDAAGGRKKQSGAFSFLRNGPGRGFGLTTLTRC